MLLTEKEIWKMRKQFRAMHEAMTEAEKNMHEMREQICTIAETLGKQTRKMTEQFCKIAAALTELEKMLNNEMTILGVPGGCQEDDFELETGQVEYDAEQCARNK